MIDGAKVIDIPFKRAGSEEAVSNVKNPFRYKAFTLCARSKHLPALSALVLYCLTGTSLTILNKWAITALPAPNVLLLFQNGLTVLLVLVLSKIVPNRVIIPPLTFSVAKAWFPAVLLFVGTLEASLLALLYESATTLIVSRNLCTLVVAGLEYCLLGTKFSTLSAVSLCGILVGALIYGLNDITITPVGCVWLGMNIVCTSLTQIFVKKIVQQSRNQERPLGPLAMSYYNNIMSLPLLATVCLVSGELPTVPAMTRGITTMQAITIFFTGVVGFVFSTLGFLLNTMVTATSIMVANTCNKFAIIFFSQVFEPRSTGPLPMLGIAIVMFFVVIYSSSMDETSNRAMHDAFARTKSVPIHPFLACLAVLSVFLVRDHLWDAMTLSNTHARVQQLDGAMHAYMVADVHGNASAAGMHTDGIFATLLSTFAANNSWPFLA
jgi:hypothetical protein